MKRKFRGAVASLLAVTLVLQNGQAVYAAEAMQIDAAAASSTSSETEENESASGEASNEIIKENPEETPEVSSEESSEETPKESTEESSEENPEETLEENSEETSAASEEVSLKEESAILEADDGKENVSDYVESAFDEQMKSNVIAHGGLDEFEKLSEGIDYAQDEIVVFAADKDGAQRIADIYGGFVKDFEYGVAVISLEGSELSAGDAFEMCLDDDLSLPYVEPNYINKIIVPETEDESSLMGEDTVPSDNAFTERWWNDGFNDEYLNPDNDIYQWHHQMINSYAAWGVTTGSPDITVGVIDSGVNIDHTDIDANIKEVKTFISESGYDGTDTMGHGTHVTGIIAGELNNSLGAGVAPNVKIVSAQIAKENGGYETADLIKAFVYLADIKVNTDDDGDVTEITGLGGEPKVDIINMSLGSDSYSSMLDEVIEETYQAGITTVAAMGNQKSEHTSYPAACDHVIGVCSVDQAGTLSYFSNFGSWADVSAPGSSILSADYSNINGYISFDGTSMAAPMVTGACALYMSAVGHVDPDTMERVIKSSVSGSAGSKTGTGILDLAKMFGGDTTAPLISINANDDANTLIGEVRDGKSYTISYGVAKDALISFTPMNFGGGTGDNANTEIVYTTDGTTPSVYEGRVTNGYLVQRDGAGNRLSVSVSDLFEDVAEEQTVTIKAMAVTGMGVSSKVSTLIFTIDPSLEEKTVDDSVHELQVEIINAPDKLIAGKSLKLEAFVSDSTDPDVTPSQAVTWKIESYSGGDMNKAGINASNGTLTTDKGQTGTLIISCTTSDSTASATTSIQVVKANPIKNIAINGGQAITLGFDYSSEPAVGETKVISITTLTDSANANLLADGSVSDKTFLWSTSNTNVFRVLSAEEDNATIQAISAGTAILTCTALDGSGKSAKVNVKVASDKKVSVVEVQSGGQSVTALNTYLDEGSISLTALQTYSDQTQGTLAPVWKSSNEKVAKVSNEGLTVNVALMSKGTATITCTAADGSGKKASVKINVQKRVEKVEILGQNYVAAGGSATFKANVYPSDAGNKNLTWSIVDNPDPDNISLSGTKLTVKKDAEIGSEIVIRATSYDLTKGGEPIVAETTLIVASKTTKVTLAPADGQSSVIATTGLSGFSKSTVLEATTDNGTLVKFTSSSDKIATVTATGNEAVVTAVGRGTATITAIATDGSGKKATYKIKVVQLVTDVTVSGQAQIARGNSAKFTASLAPSNADYKNLTWMVIDPETGDEITDGTITVKDGKVTVTGDAEIGKKIRVCAYPRDYGTDTCKAAVVTITEAKATNVYVQADSSLSDKVNIPVTKKDTLTSLRLYDTDIPQAAEFAENRVVLKDVVRSISKTSTTDLTEVVDVYWSSSNPKIATVNVSDDGTATVTAVKAGSTNIVCTALDGSGKKASVKVTVITPASGIEVTPGKGVINDGDGYFSFLAEGKKDTAKAALGSAYGKATTSKVTWDYEIGYAKYNEETKNYEFEKIDDRYKNDYKKNKVFFTLSNGKVTANTNRAAMISFERCMKKYGVPYDTVSTYPPAARIIAKTTDGTEYSDDHLYIITTLASYVQIKSPINGQIVKTDTYRHDEINGVYNYYVDSDAWLGASEYTVTSSNSKVVTGYCAYDSNNGRYNLYVAPHAAGTAKVTISLLDGSGKKASITIKVK